MKFKNLFPLMLSTLACTVSAQPKVVSSIYPLQQIANAVTGQETGLISDTYLSPHDYTVKPKDAQRVLDADLFIWVDENIIPQLHSHVERRVKKLKPTISATSIEGIQLIEFAHASADKEHGHEKEAEHEHGHEKEAEHEHGHKKEAEHEHGHKKEAEHEHGHEKEAEHEHGHKKETEAYHHEDSHGHDHSAMQYDPHVWLSTENAIVIATEIAMQLSTIDAKNSSVYEENLKKFITSVTLAKAEIEQGLKDNAPQPYFVFHDAYQYFEKEFNVKHVDVIRAHAGQAPLTKHLMSLRNALQNSQACLFREPQFKSPLVDQLSHNTDVTVSVLDPLGYQKDTVDIENGYITIVKNIANQLQSCCK